MFVLEQNEQSENQGFSESQNLQNP